jgi:hypothetical protein
MTLLLAVTVLSMLLATIMSAIAWRVTSDERRRSEARIAALAAEIYADGEVPLVRDRIDSVWPGVSDPPIFTARQSQANSRPFAIVAGGALVCAAAIAIAVAIAIVSSGRFSEMTPRAERTAAARAAAPVTAAPLELLALGDERIGDDLTVRGIIRNPASGAGVERLTAVVVAFAPDGGLLESGRAEVNAVSLRPGGESTFAITVPRAAGVARYRLSFRTDDRVVPHLDRRHES